MKSSAALIRFCAAIFCLLVLLTWVYEGRRVRAPISTAPSLLPTLSPSPLPTPDPRLQQRATVALTAYLNTLEQKGLNLSQQGIWVGINNQELASHQRNLPLSAASLTKVATTLVALDRWGAKHRFEIRFYTTGQLQNQTLNGDLWLMAGGDPFFVWEAAFQLGHVLERKGIRQVQGNLIILGDFAMNFERDPIVAGNLLKTGINANLWPTEAQEQYRSLPTGVPKPRVVITGTVQTRTQLAPDARPLVAYQSFQLSTLLKRLNAYSNNTMSDILADALGGGKAIARRAAELARVPPQEIQLINGSGLGRENRISPRATCALFRTISEQLAPQQLQLSDIFSRVGESGTIQNRSLPAGTIAKTGTLRSISTLAGIVPVGKTSLCFAILNQAEDLDFLREKQDIFVRSLQF